MKQTKTSQFMLFPVILFSLIILSGCFYIPDRVIELELAVPKSEENPTGPDFEPEQSFTPPAIKG